MENYRELQFKKGVEKALKNKGLLTPTELIFINGMATRIRQRHFNIERISNAQYNWVHRISESLGELK